MNYQNNYCALDFQDVLFIEEPKKSNSSFGNWVCHEQKVTRFCGRNYEKSAYFMTKKAALAYRNAWIKFNKHGVAP